MVDTDANAIPEEWTPRLARVAGSSHPVFVHPCHVCGDPNAAFGEGVALLKGKPGRWTCFAHWPGREAAMAARLEAEAAFAPVPSNQMDLF